MTAQKKYKAQEQAVEPAIKVSIFLVLEDVSGLEHWLDENPIPEEVTIKTVDFSGAPFPYPRLATFLKRAIQRSQTVGEAGVISGKITPDGDLTAGEQQWLGRLKSEVLARLAEIKVADLIHSFACSERYLQRRVSV